MSALGQKRTLRAYSPAYLVPGQQISPGSRLKMESHHPRSCCGLKAYGLGQHLALKLPRERRRNGRISKAPANIIAAIFIAASMTALYLFVSGVFWAVIESGSEKPCG